MTLRSLTVLILAPTAALVAAPLSAQGRDAGVLTISSPTREIGVESFQVTPRSGGVRITSHAVYGPPRAGSDYSLTLDRDSAATELAWQLERKSPEGGEQFYVVGTRSRVTIRRIAKGTERANEMPGGPGTVVLSDSVFAPFLQIVPLATDEGRALTAIFTYPPRRIPFTARSDSTGPDGGRRIRLSGGLVGEVVLGNDGRLLRISLPDLGLSAERKQD